MKNIASVYSVLGLGLLLLLSPCKVRNFVQAELGVEQTQVSSKSQSLAPQFSCQTQEIVQAKATTSKLEAKQFSYAGPINFSVDFDATFLQASIQNDYARPKVASSVPLYILYSNLKVYL
ncbi:hypothetical protein [Psychroflexus montanilacus]|uniref:hypothetical protein n=1 Tax=Psychroflexus montanilacus TaxID=2873598 RepID=UPI001CCDEA2D|nr:hypothetical protein [Psychroflexus montanilacus]MBZ9651006.1 hypothetical protein [Psychroflexus montanilacus]